MRVRQVGRGLDLSQEAFGPHYRCEFGFQDLERHLALVLEVIGQVDRRHPAFAKLTLDGIAAFEGCVQASDGIGHRVRPRSRRNDAPIIWCGGRLRTYPIRAHLSTLWGGIPPHQRWDPVFLITKNALRERQTVLKGETGNGKISGGWGVRGSPGTGIARIRYGTRSGCLRCPVLCGSRLDPIWTLKRRNGHPRSR